MRSKKRQIYNECEAIRKKHRGILRPADVVAFAKDPETTLHSQFTWDDGKAAEQYRLWQARSVIEMVVELRPVADGPKELLYLSLPSDRRNPGGGYRHVQDIVADKALYAELLTAAMQDLTRLREKYKRIKELKAVFAAIDKAAARAKVGRGAGK